MTPSPQPTPFGLQYAKHGGPYRTQLYLPQEAAFLQWARQNNVPFDDSPHSDYDMRGYYQAMLRGDPKAKQTPSLYDGKLHFPDTWKTPYHATFSNESIYATPNAPHWEGDKLVNQLGGLVKDETPPPAVPGDWSRMSVVK